MNRDGGPLNDSLQNRSIGRVAYSAYFADEARKLASLASRPKRHNGQSHPPSFPAGTQARRSRCSAARAVTPKASPPTTA